MGSYYLSTMMTQQNNGGRWAPGYRTPLPSPTNHTQRVGQCRGNGLRKERGQIREMTGEGRRGIMESTGAGDNPTEGRALEHQDTAREGRLRRRQGSMLGPMGSEGKGLPLHLTI